MGCGRRSRGGFSLLEVLIAMVVLAIALLGVMGVLLATHQHNTSTSETSSAYIACQEVVEQLRAMNYDTMKQQHNLGFVAKKIHPSWPIGLIEIEDVSPAADPDTKAEIRVAIRTQPGQVGKMPINVQVVSWRSRR